MTPISQLPLTSALPNPNGGAARGTDHQAFAEVIAGMSMQVPVTGSSAGEGVPMAPAQMQPQPLAPIGREPASAYVEDKQVPVAGAEIRLADPAAQIIDAGEATDAASPSQSGLSVSVGGAVRVPALKADAPSPARPDSPNLDGAAVRVRMPKVAASDSQAESDLDQVDGEDAGQESAPAPVHEALAAVFAILSQAADAQGARPTVRTAQKPDQENAPEARIANSPQQRAGQSLLGRGPGESSKEAESAEPNLPSGPATQISSDSPFGNVLQAHNTGAGRSIEHFSAVPPSSQHVLDARQIGDAADVVDLHQLDALVRDVSQITGNVGRASFRLAGEQLGPLEVRLHTSDAGVTVNIRTETEQSLATVTHAQRQLTEDMRANGLRVAETSVTLSHGGTDRERNDRNSQLGFSPQIESIKADTSDTNSRDDRRPAGRYA